MTECVQCDYESPVRMGRGKYLCRVCGKDISLAVYLLEEVFAGVPDKAETRKRIGQWIKAKDEAT